MPIIALVTVSIEQLPTSSAHVVQDLLSAEDAADRRQGDQLLAYGHLSLSCRHRPGRTQLHFNELAASPFWTHWHRHHLVANHFDVSNIEKTGGGELA